VFVDAIFALGTLVEFGKGATIELEGVLLCLNYGCQLMMLHVRLAAMPGKQHNIPFHMLPLIPTELLQQQRPMKHEKSIATPKYPPEW
jgi:hypothetical protein